MKSKRTPTLEVVVPSGAVIAERRDERERERERKKQGCCKCGHGENLCPDLRTYRLLQLQLHRLEVGE